MPTSLETTTFSIVVGGAVDVVARVVATVGKEKVVIGAEVAWLASLVGAGLSSLKATTPKRTSKAARTTYQRRHQGPLDDGPLGGGDPQRPAAGVVVPSLLVVRPVLPSPKPPVTLVAPGAWWSGSRRR
jgi:hypothetical protein